MDILHLRCFLFFWLNLLEIFADQIPSQWRNSDGLMCTFSDGQRCTENLQQNTTEARNGWRLQRAPSVSGDYFARVACSQPCQDSVTVLQDVQGSLKPLLLSFYYSIWTPLSSLDPSPPALSIFSCSDDPNWNSEIDLSDSISPQWRGAVISLLCKETFNVSFVASVSSAYQGVVIDNIAMPFKFTTKGILNRPSYEIPAPLGMTDGPIETTDKMAPDVSVTSSMVTETIGYGSLSTDVAYESYNGVPYRTLAMSDGLNRNIENHVAYKPAIIMLFILIVCSTTVIIHLLICKNQRSISSRLRRVSTSVSPPSDEQRKVSPEVYVTSYSSTNTASEPRTVSFVSQSGEVFPEEEEEDEKGNKKSETKEAAKRRMSIACMERLSKPSKLRPHGRANTTPTNPKDDLYESIDVGSGHIIAEESVSKRLLRKISPSRLPRFLESARSSSSDLQKNTNKDIASSNSSSLLSVTFDPSTRNNRKLNGNCLTPPLPPRTYPIGERAADAKKSNSTSQLAPKKGTSSSLSVEGRLPPKVQEDRRWSDINVGGITISKKTVNNQSRAVSECKEADSWSLVSRETLVEKQDDRQQTTDGDAEHGYYVLQRPRDNSTISDEMTDARSIDTKSIESENGSHNYHILERGLEVDYSSSVDVESIGDGSSLVESNAYQSLGGSLCSHHTYQSLEQQESIAMSDESFEKDSTPSLNRQSNICYGDTLSRRALIAKTKFREGGIDEKVVDDNNGYSIPIVQKVRDGNIPSDYNSREYRCTQSSLGSTKEKYCASVTSETSGYNQLMRKECNLAIESETESSGGYDHIKR